MGPGHYKPLKNTIEIRAILNMELLAMSTNYSHNMMSEQ